MDFSRSNRPLVALSRKRNPPGPPLAGVWVDFSQPGARLVGVAGGVAGPMGVTGTVAGLVGVAGEVVDAGAVAGVPFDGTEGCDVPLVFPEGGFAGGGGTGGAGRPLHGREGREPGGV